ncbi:MAG: hypothetical protein HQK52_18345 [Oligoflexia bacterium]|nr:hypothetical protein [Oligoflexia bacterium]
MKVKLFATLLFLPMMLLLLAAIKRDLVGDRAIMAFSKKYHQQEQLPFDFTIRGIKHAPIPFATTKSYPEQKVTIYFRLDILQNPYTTADTLTLALCHEMGHYLSPAEGPKKIVYGILSERAVEGESDYYAVTKCLPKFYPKLDQAKLLQISEDFLKMLAYDNGRKLTHADLINYEQLTKVAATLEYHPSYICRMKTFLDGFAQQKRADCWYAGEKQASNESLGNTPLMLAAYYGDEALFQKQFKQHAHDLAYLNRSNRAGESALTLSIRKAHLQLARQLLLAGADPFQGEESCAFELLTLIKERSLLALIGKRYKNRQSCQ